MAALRRQKARAHNTTKPGEQGVERARVRHTGGERARGSYGARSSIVIAESRVLCTDDDSRRHFKGYSP